MSELPDTPHINPGGAPIAQTVLMPGDPLRARFIAETYLDDVVQFNAVRNMLGFTGTWKGQEVSVMGSGMGQPSASIYVTELMKFYGVERVIRVGTTGGIACGMMMSRKVWNGLRFSAVEASHWPRGTLSSPARYTSAQ